MPVAASNAHLAKELKHDSPLIGCRFDLAGKYLVVSAQDSTLQRFDLASAAKTPFLGHESWVRGMAFVPKSDTLVSGDYHGKLIWWNATDEKPKPIRTIEAHDGWVRAVAASVDGKLIASCGNDRLVKLWNAADGKLVGTLSGHEDHVYNVAFHPEGQFLVSADLKGIVKVWDIAKRTLVRDLDATALHLFDSRFVAHIGGVRSMTFDAAGTRLACAGITNVSNAFAGVGNPLVVVFDWASGKATQLKTKEAFQGTAWGVAFHPAGFIFAVGGGRGGGAWFWSGTAATSSHEVKLPAAGRDMDLHPKGETFAVAGSTGTAYIYSLLPAPPKPDPKAKPKPKK